MVQRIGGSLEAYPGGDLPPRDQSSPLILSRPDSGGGEVEEIMNWFSISTNLMKRFSDSLLSWGTHQFLFHWDAKPASGDLIFFFKVGKWGQQEPPRTVITREGRDCMRALLGTWEGLSKWLLLLSVCSTSSLPSRLPDVMQ